MKMEEKKEIFNKELIMSITVFHKESHLQSIKCNLSWNKRYLHRIQSNKFETAGGLTSSQSSTSYHTEDTNQYQEY